MITSVLPDKRVMISNPIFDNNALAGVWKRICNLPRKAETKFTLPNSKRDQPDANFNP